MSLFKSIRNATFISAIGTIASYALTIILARMSDSAEPFGIYMLCLTWAAVMTVLIDCASSSSFSHISIKSDNIQAAFNTVITVRLVAFLGLCLIFTLAKISKLTDLPWQVLIFIIPSLNLGILFEYYRTNTEFAVIICIEKISLFLMCNLLLKYYSFETSIYLSYATIAIFSLVYQALIQFSHVRQFKFTSCSIVSNYLVLYWPIILIGVSQIGYGHVSRLVIEYKQGIIVFASLSLAFQIVSIASMIQTQVDRSFRPALIDSIHKKDLNKLRILLQQYFGIGVLPMILLSLICYVSAPYFISFVFGPEYQIASDILQVISPLFLSISLMRLSDHIMLGLDLFKQNLTINFCTSFLMILMLSCLPSTKPLVAFLIVIVGAQYLQIIISGSVFVYALRRRFI
jgi:O-antigen/teichoic acid export membrane protein